MKNKKLIKLHLKFKKQLKNFNPSKTFIGTFALLIGVSTTLLAQNISQRTETKKYHLTSPKEDRIFHQPTLSHNSQHLFHDSFFSGSIFEEINQMQREIDRSIRMHQNKMEKIFHVKDKNKNSITKAETRDKYIYQLDIAGYEDEEIRIDVKDKTLTISANSSQNQQRHSSFHYSFYLPKLNSKLKPQIERQKNILIITLSKY